MWAISSLRTPLALYNVNSVVDVSFGSQSSSLDRTHVLSS